MPPFIDEEKSNYDLDASVWRYMRVSRFEELLQSSTLYFASANEFGDPFEGAVAVQPYDWPVDPRYPDFEHAEKAFRELKRLTKISCWHFETYESNAMWQLYSDSGKGVAIVSTPRKLSESLTPYRIQPTYGVERLWLGKVSYVDLLRERLKVGNMERFFHKHTAFLWEKEFRLAVSLTAAEEFGVVVPKDGIFVSCNLGEVIQDIYIGPSVESEERKRIIEMCNLAGFGGAVKVSSLLGNPRYI